MAKAVGEKLNNRMLFLLYIVCCITAMSAAGFIWLTTGYILDYHGAREFLSVTESIPRGTLSCVLQVTAGMLLLGLTYQIRVNQTREQDWVILATLGADFLIGLWVIMLLDFNYNGVLLWVFANILIYVRKNRYWPAIIALGIISYVGTGYEMVSVRMRLFNIDDYIQVYSSSAQTYLFAAWNFLEILSIVCFVGCCLGIIANREEKLEQTNELYRQLAEANENLKLANEELSEIMEEKAKMAEVRERNRIAREIHDTMGHTLTGIAAGIDACIALSDSSPELVKQQLKILSDVSRKGLSDVRHSVNELRPDSLEHLNLEAAIRQMVDNMKQVSGTKISFTCQVPVLKFDEDEENVIYRIIQESITNSIRHGHASEIRILIERGQWDSVLHLSISDNGKGCEHMKEGFGIRHIRERVRMLNGEVTFTNDNGFRVDAEIPIRWGEEYD